MRVRTERRGLIVACTVVALSACGTEAPADGMRTDLETDSVDGTASRMLGPVDGRDLPGADLGRVAVGDPAPDFSLMSYRGDVLTLSDHRGERDILLVFYRGHW